MNQVDRLANEQRPHVGQEKEKVGHRRRCCEDWNGQIVHLEQAPGEVTDAQMSRMGVRDDDDLARPAKQH